MDWGTFGASVLAGGLAGQLATLFGGNYLTQRRELKKWRLNERYKLFSEMMTTVTTLPANEDELNAWTYKIREISQKIHILYEKGTAPDELALSMEAVFKLAQEKKDGNISESWSDDMRTKSSELRKKMSQEMTSN